MDLREEYERFQKAQQEAPKLIAKAKAYGSTTSDRARAAAARRDADPERMLKKIAEARAKESRDIDRLVPSELQHALLALMRLEINNLLPHPLRGLTECYTDDEAPLVAKLDAQGQAYWGPDMGDGGGSEYASYFKVIDASVSEEGEVLPKIRVVDGAHSSDPYYLFAGPVYVNGVRENNVPSYTIGVPVVDDEVVDSTLWLIVARTNIDAECNLSFELRTDEDGEPDAAASTFGYRYIPIARIIGSGGMSFRIVQDHYGPAIATFNTFSGYVVHADGGRTYVGPPTGVYLLVDIITGAARYDDAEPEDKSRMNFYLVAEKIDVENGVVYRPLDGITVGDVRIDFAPYAELPGWQQEET